MNKAQKQRLEEMAQKLWSTPARVEAYGDGYGIFLPRRPFLGCVLGSDYGSGDADALEAALKSLLATEKP